MGTADDHSTISGKSRVGASTPFTMLLQSLAASPPPPFQAGRMDHGCGSAGRNQERGAADDGGDFPLELRAALGDLEQAFGARQVRECLAWMRAKDQHPSGAPTHKRPKSSSTTGKRARKDKDCGDK